VAQTHHVPIRIGGVLLEQRLSTAARELADRVVALLVEELPVYATLPAEQLSGDINGVVLNGIRGFTHALRTGSLPDAEQLAALHSSAARRAEERIPLDAVAGAYFLGAHECLEQVLAEATPEDLPDVRAAYSLLLRYLQVATGSVFAGYIQERQAAFGEEQIARQGLLSALLDGTPSQQAAERAGMRLPAGYWVLSITAAQHPDEDTPGVDPAIAARRKVRRLRVELERQAPGSVLTALSPDGGLALLPAASPTAADGTDTRLWDRLRGTVRQIARVSDVELTVAAVVAEPSGVAEAARLAARIREVALACGRGPGLYRLDDVLLEYQLTLPSPARDRLAATLGPLAAHPDLLATLRTFLATGLDRRRTAEELHVHPNTVDYRLRRATALTGLNPAHGADLPRIHAALAALAVDPATGPADRPEGRSPQLGRVSPPWPRTPGDPSPGRPW
jgi:hypothetical protein